MTNDDGLPAVSRRALNTAYGYNTRMRSPARRVIRSGWHGKIDELLQRDHVFLGCTYSREGFLYRGVRSGLRASICAGHWRESEDSGPLGELERELGIFLLSHEISDALAVARFWEHTADAAIFVFPAATFDALWQRGEAAVLGFAEPGVVFRYPFLIHPLALHEISAAIARAPTEPYPGDMPLIGLGNVELANRAATEAAIRNALQRRGLGAAVPVATGRYPRAV
ncbi:MAG: hypothetical protein ACT4NU_13935 [Chromatiales bacterium]